MSQNKIPQGSFDFTEEMQEDAVIFSKFAEALETFEASIDESLKKMEAIKASVDEKVKRTEASKETFSRVLQERNGEPLPPVGPPDEKLSFKL